MAWLQRAVFTIRSFTVGHFNKLLTIASRSSPCRRISSTFIPVFNTVTRKMEWELCEDEYDYHQEIARSGFADMLHDIERNEKFDLGIKRAISLVHSRGQPSRVLDIGTGTGLLSMMAVRAGAQHVTACEAFKPMSDCASQVMADNKMQDRIQLVHKRSTEMTVGPGGDMTERANILVAELLDTELIGEGAIHTYRHAHQYLMTADCIVVPQTANIYIQLVNSTYLSHHNLVTPLPIPGTPYTVTVPQELGHCGGTPSVHDLQLDQLTSNKFTPVSPPTRVYRFDFTGKTELPMSNSSTMSVTSLTAARVDAVLMWWDIEMDTEGEVEISCAPSWARPDANPGQWRDHWLQAVYYPSKPVCVTKGQEVKVTSYHDDYSFWFDVASNKCDVIKPIERPICECGHHVAVGRQRIAMLNHTYRRSVYLKALSKVIKSDSVCLVIGDGSLLPYMAAHMGAHKVYILDNDSMLRRINKQFIQVNDLDGRVHVIEEGVETLNSSHFDNKKIDVIISEPHTMGSNSVSDNFYAWYAMTYLTNLLAPSVSILPASVTVKAIAVEFDNLWKINSPVRECEGFNMESFDRLIEFSIDRADAYLEPHPLWEYPCKALTKHIDLLHFDWTQPLFEYENCTFDGSAVFESSGTCNGIVVWSEYDFKDAGIISNGVIQPCIPGEKIHWDPYNKQNVHIIRYPKTVTSSKTVLKCWANFSPIQLDFDFKFDVSPR